MVQKCDKIIGLFASVSSQITYYNQASPEVLPYISTDIAGLSSSFYHIFCSCRQYLTQNRLPSACEDESSLQRALSSGSQSSESDTERLTAVLIGTQL